LHLSSPEGMLRWVWKKHSGIPNSADINSCVQIPLLGDHAGPRTPRLLVPPAVLSLTPELAFWQNYRVLPNGCRPSESIQLEFMSYHHLSLTSVHLEVSLGVHLVHLGPQKIERGSRVCLLLCGSCVQYSCTGPPFIMMLSYLSGC
jgi:hypothetical protein